MCVYKLLSGKPQSAGTAAQIARFAAVGLMTCIDPTLTDISQLNERTFNIQRKSEKRWGEKIQSFYKILS